MSARYQCSQAALERQEPMFATGSQVYGWVMIEVRGAWGEDAIHESALGEHVPEHFKNDLKRRHIRAVCIRGVGRADDGPIRLFACAARRPGRGEARMWQREVDSLGEALPAIAALGVSQAPEGGWELVHEPLILVCTNGRHDQCCANRGRPLVRSLRDSAWADRVWECSHIGGDRFAPNVVVLPGSLYFGRVEPEDAPGLLQAIDEGRIDLARFRGRTAYNIAEQAVEHFVRQQFAIDVEGAVIVEGRTEDGSFVVRIDDEPVHVRIRRRMVSVAEPLTCHGSADQLVPQFTLVSIEGVR